MANTQDAFRAVPMSSYDPLSQPVGRYNNIPGVTLESIQDRMIPRQMATGTTRGQQSVGNKNVKIDGTNGRFFVRDEENDQEGIFGKTPDGTLALVITKAGYTIEDAITAD